MYFKELFFLQLNLRIKGEAQGPFRMGPHRPETRLLRKLLRAPALRFRHKRPKSRGVYVPHNPLTITPPSGSLCGVRNQKFAYRQTSLVGVMTLY